MLLGGLFLPTFRGTVGLMGSSCASWSSWPSWLGETDDVSAPIGILLTVIAAEDGVLRPDSSDTPGLGLR